MTKLARSPLIAMLSSFKNERFPTIIFILACLSSCMGQLANDTSGVGLFIISPDPGGSLPSSDSTIETNFHMEFTLGPLADAIRLQPSRYQVCYSGGAVLQCIPLGEGSDGDDGGEGAVVESENLVGTQEGYTEAFVNQLGSLARHLPPGVQIPVTGAAVGPTKVVQIQGGGLGVVRAWVSAVKAPLVPVGAQPRVVYLWQSPFLAEVLLERQLRSLVADGSVVEDTEVRAEKAALLFHLGVALQQQLDTKKRRQWTAMLGGDKGAALHDAVNATGVLAFEEEISQVERERVLGKAKEAVEGSAVNGYYAEAVEAELSGLAALTAKTLHQQQHRSVTQRHSSTSSANSNSADDANHIEDDSESDDDYGLFDDEKEHMEEEREESDARMAALLNRVALVTISNIGYSDYTLNAMASLRLFCRLPCALQVVCLDQKCFDKLQNSSEARLSNCQQQQQQQPPPQASNNNNNVYLARTFLSSVAQHTGDENSLGEFATYNSATFNSIVRFKFAVISKFLKSDGRDLNGGNKEEFAGAREFVLFTDGDIVFVKRSFLATALSVLENPSAYGAKSWVPVEAAEYGPSGEEGIGEASDTTKQQQPHAVSSSSSSAFPSSPTSPSSSSSSQTPTPTNQLTFDLAAQCDAGHSEEQCDWQRQRYGAGALCSGLMLIRSTPETRELFDPNLVFADASYLASFEDQMYMNTVLARRLGQRITTLNRFEFPNGAFRKGPHFNLLDAKLIHFNYNFGHQKIWDLKEAGLWFLDQDGTTPHALSTKSTVVVVGDGTGDNPTNDGGGTELEKLLRAREVAHLRRRNREELKRKSNALKEQPAMQSLKSHNTTRGIGRRLELVVDASTCGILSKRRMSSNHDGELASLLLQFEKELLLSSEAQNDQGRTLQRRQWVGHFTALLASRLGLRLAQSSPAAAAAAALAPNISSRLSYLPSEGLLLSRATSEARDSLPVLVALAGHQKEEKEAAKSAVDVETRFSDREEHSVKDLGSGAAAFLGFVYSEIWDSEFSEWVLLQDLGFLLPAHPRSTTVEENSGDDMHSNRGGPSSSSINSSSSSSSSTQLAKIKLVCLSEPGDQTRSC